MMSEEKKNQILETDVKKRRFLIASAKLFTFLGAFLALTPFIASWLPRSSKMKPKPLKINLNQLKIGEKLTVEWQGKPVWIIKRSPSMLENLKKTRLKLRDPDSLVEQQPPYAKNEYRSINPEYLVLIGLCTHLGCSPKLINTKDRDKVLNEGFYCPCHGSSFDLAGRVFKNVPAPINLAVPPHRFIQSDVILIGED